jgi:hypothetical protein
VVTVTIPDRLEKLASELEEESRNSEDPDTRRILTSLHEELENIISIALVEEYKSKEL